MILLSKEMQGSGRKNYAFNTHSIKCFNKGIFRPIIWKALRCINSAFELSPFNVVCLMLF